jgi:hypothetical protein
LDGAGRRSLIQDIPDDQGQPWLLRKLRWIPNQRRDGVILREGLLQNLASGSPGRAEKGDMH